MNEVINNNKYELKCWFALRYIHGRKFMIGTVFTYQRLSKDFILCYFIGCQFLWAQKRLPIAKKPCITPGINQNINFHFETFKKQI